MRTETKEIKVYKFNELSDEAKEKVENTYLELQDADFFEINCKELLKEDYGIDTLDIAFSLNNCQGDGLCLYGKVSFEKDTKFFEIATKELTDEEKKIAIDNISYINFDKFNHSYCHVHTVHIEIDGEDETDENKEIYNKIILNVKQWFYSTCRKFEDFGYDYFYEVTEEDLEAWCEANEYEFLENGTIYC